MLAFAGLVPAFFGLGDGVLGALGVASVRSARCAIDRLSVHAADEISLEPHLLARLTLRLAPPQAIYPLPELSGEMKDDMTSSPYEMRSDSFYFVDNKLVMHNKSAYCFAE